LNDEVAQAIEDGDITECINDIPSLNKIQSIHQRTKEIAGREWEYLIDVEEWAKIMMAMSKSDYDMAREDHLLVIGYKRHQFTSDGKEKQGQSLPCHNSCP
jgi:hypothetical protein